MLKHYERKGPTWGVKFFQTFANLVGLREWILETAEIEN